MNLDELIKKLEDIREENDGEIICCTFNNHIEDYSNELCLEIVDDDYYIDENHNKIVGKKILLF